VPRDAKIDGLIAALEPTAREHGFEIVEAELLGGSGMPILRVYIDTLDRGEIITLDKIAEAQQEWLDGLIDEFDPIEGEYTLEVSSPGVDRPLRTLEHFEEFEGEEVKITTDPIDGRKRFSGILEGIEGNLVVVEGHEGETFEIPHEAIVKARIKRHIEFTGKIGF
jgi:ribosome maturation factor RimP